MTNKRKRKVVVLLFTAFIGSILIALNCNKKVFAVNVNLSRNDISETFSVMTFNVNALNPQKVTQEYQESLFKIIKQENPDILILQELSFSNYEKIQPYLESIYGDCDSLNINDPLLSLRFFSRYQFGNFVRYSCEERIDTTALSEKEIKEVVQLQKALPVMSAEFEVYPNHRITVFSSHLRSSAYTTARRSLDKNAYWSDGISLYKRNYEVGKRIRNYEAVNVRRFVDDVREEGMPLIVAGDLNDWCGSDCLNTLMGDNLKDAWWEGGNGFGWTYFGWHLRLRLDHILYSDELELVDVKVIDTDISDHKPLMARFRIK